jgi:hypothetical protein
MRLDMHNRRTLANEVSPVINRRKKKKGIILDEFRGNTGYKRKYAIHL